MGCGAGRPVQGRVAAGRTVVPLDNAFFDDSAAAPHARPLAAAAQLVPSAFGSGNGVLPAGTDVGDPRWQAMQAPASESNAHEQLVEKLKFALASNISDRDAQDLAVVKALRNIRRASVNEAATLTLGAAGGVQAAFEAISRADAHRDVLQEGLLAVQDLLTGCEANVRHAVACSGPATLVAILTKHALDDSMVALCCCNLRVLSTDEADCRAAVTSAGGRHAVIEALRQHGDMPAIVLDCMWTLSELLTSDIRSDIVVVEGLIPLVLAQFSRHPRSLDIAVMTLACVARLALVKDCESALLRDGAAIAVIDCVRRHWETSEPIALQGAHALQNLTTCEASQRIVGRSGAEVLVQVLSKWHASAGVAAPALTALRNLLLVPLHVPAAVAAGVIPTVIALLEEYAKDDKAVANCVSVLHCVAVQHDLIAQIVAAGVLQLLDSIEVGAAKSETAAALRHQLTGASASASTTSAGIPTH